MKRVVFFSHSQALGGAELSMLEIMVRMDRSRFQPVMLAPGSGALSERAAQMGIEVGKLDLPPSLLEWHRDSQLPIETFLSAFGSAVKIAGWLRETRPAVIYTHSQKAHILGGLAGRLVGVPVVWHLRDIMQRPGLKAMESGLGRWLPRRIIAASRAAKDQFPLADLANRIIVIPNGIDTEAIKGAAGAKKRAREILKIGSRCPLVGMVGRVAPRKGQHIFIQAARAVADEFPRARFLIIGGPLFGEEGYYREVKKLTQGLGMEDRIFFTGHREEALSLMASLDVIVHCSTAPEPYSRAVAEAMALKIPVISVRSGGILEMIDDGVEGLLVPPGDPSALSRAMIELLGQPALRRRLARAAAVRIERHFRLEPTVRRIEKILEEV